MTAALERLGLTRCFDLVVGSSAGALNAAALLGGVAVPAAAMYHTVLASRSFVNPVRLLFGRPALDVRFVLAHADGDLDAERHQRTISSPIPLHCVALDVDSAKPCEFTGMRTKDELWQVLLATTRMPWIGGDPVAIGDRRYIDGALTTPIPVEQRDRRRRDPRARAADASVRRAAIGRRPRRRIADRPLPAPPEPGARDDVARAHRRSTRQLVEPTSRGGRSRRTATARTCRAAAAGGHTVVTQLERRPEILLRAARTPSGWSKRRLAE